MAKAEGQEEDTVYPHLSGDTQKGWGVERGPEPAATIAETFPPHTHPSTPRPHTLSQVPPGLVSELGRGTPCSWERCTQSRWLVVSTSFLVTKAKPTPEKVGEVEKEGVGPRTLSPGTLRRHTCCLVSSAWTAAGPGGGRGSKFSPVLLVLVLRPDSP